MFDWNALRLAVQLDYSHLLFGWERRII